MKEMPSKTVLAKNLRLLMDNEDLSEAKAAQKTGVSQKGINKILNENTSATIDIIERIAKAFKMPTWQILTPNLEIEEAELIKSYRIAPDQAKIMIKSVAEAATPYQED